MPLASPRISSCSSSQQCAANDGVQLLLAGKVYQILTVFLQSIVGILRVVIGDALVAAHCCELLQELINAKPSEPNEMTLLRLCDVHNIPMATNIATAEVLIHGLERGDLDWRDIVHPQN